MLTYLSIRNIVLIEACDIALQPGLCVLTGETGAGKSILLDALGLALGARGEAGLVRHGEAQGSVSAEFDISANEPAQAVMRELELEVADTLIVRRNIGVDGKTRCLINDRPVSVLALRRLGETLIEIHGQHDQRSLQDASVHRALLDDYGRLHAKRKAVAQAHQRWHGIRRELDALQDDIARGQREQEYLRHMRGELRELGPRAGEEEELATQRTHMMQSEKLYGLLDDALAELNHGKGVVAALRSAQRIIARSTIASAGQFAQAIEALERAAMEAEEAGAQLETLGQEATYDPAKLEQIEERLFALKAAARKYNLPADELPQLLEEVEEKLTRIDSQEHRISALLKEAMAARGEYEKAAVALSGERAKAAAKLQKAVESELAPLKMAGTRFRVRLQPLPEASWSDWGMVSVHFEAATNVSRDGGDIPYATLNKIASGGELSRFMLAMKVAMSGVRSVPSFIFDEIDTGTGGAVADAIGRRLSRLGDTAQVLVVTHLPQVAARGTQHVLVQKCEKGRKVVTQVRELTPEEREEELARMLAGAEITSEARKAAQKLLEDAV